MIRRSREIATRMALGASRGQILGQLWSESLVLALLGGAAGIVAGALALRGLLTLLPAHFLPVASVRLDLRVLAFTLGVSIVASVLFGMLPALTANRVELRPAMGGRGIAGGSVRLRQSLITGEVALTVVLLAAAGLLNPHVDSPRNHAARIQSGRGHHRQGVIGRGPLSRPGRFPGTTRPQPRGDARDSRRAQRGRGPDGAV
jgi:predicted lysophospholipase L1 biosynthesis ABC-type transport system permease subunit